MDLLELIFLTFVRKFSMKLFHILFLWKDFFFGIHASIVAKSSVSLKLEHESNFLRRRRGTRSIK